MLSARSSLGQLIPLKRSEWDWQHGKNRVCATASKRTSPEMRQDRGNKKLPLTSLGAMQNTIGQVSMGVMKNLL